ncbi:MAG: acyl carrier protein [Gammaproteobacteria bacterium]|nr:acyl carrier protein [Gammaproteobacteria bacterium]MDH5628644.1 acyl carrier protein [Gammaproteobacteria bacterium]
MQENGINPQVKQLLIETLSLDMSPESMPDDMQLLGNLPEFDSLAIVSIITSLEETFDFVAEDDELSAEIFESVQALTNYVATKTAQN